MGLFNKIFARKTSCQKQFEKENGTQQNANEDQINHPTTKNPPASVQESEPVYFKVEEEIIGANLIERGNIILTLTTT